MKRLYDNENAEDPFFVLWKNKIFAFEKNKTVHPIYDTLKHLITPPKNSLEKSAQVICGKILQF